MNLRQTTALLMLLSIGTPTTQAQCVLSEVQSWFPADGGSLDVFGASVVADGDFAAITASGDDDIASNSGAVYMYRRVAGVWTPFQKLKAADAAASAAFGASIDLHGEVLAVGAVGASVGANFTGAAYVFRFDGAAWVQEAKLIHGDPEAGDTLGNAIGVHGDTLVVASDNKQIGFDDNAGAVYAFRYHGPQQGWVQEQKIVSPLASPFDFFGWSLAVDADRVLVGAIDEDGQLTNQGAAFLFRRSGGVWSLEQSLEAGDPSGDDQYGYSVALDGDVAVIGANHHDGAGEKTGAVYVYRRVASAWSLEQKILTQAAQPFDQFGTRVAVDGALLAAHSPLNDLAGNNSGASYVFRSYGGVWVEQATLLGTGIDASDDYGAGLSVDGETVLCGAPGTSPFGGSSGSCYAHVIPDLSLDMQPDHLPAGTPFDLFACGGAPADPMAVLITEVGGAPVFVPLVTSAFDGLGRFHLPGVMPAVGGLSGLTITLTAFAQGPFFSVLSSNPEVLSFP